jgi:CubicO group peptidase (beta-lactamase class C family)
MGVANATTKDAVTERTTFEAASLSKPLFGFFVMTFVEKGQLDLDRPLADYFSYEDLAHDERYKKITARMVLTHRTGLPNWREGNRLNIAFEPGSGFQYSGEGYQYLALVLAKIANTDAAGLDALFQTRVAQPLGMTQTRFVPTAAQKAFKAAPHRAGGFIAPASVKENVFGAAYSVETEALDLAKWTVGMMNSKALAPQSYERFFQPQKVAIPANHPQRPFGLTDWALGFSVFETPAGRLYTHGGNNQGYTSVIAFNRERGTGFVALTNADQAAPFIIDLFGYFVRTNASAN